MIRILSKHKFVKTLPLAAHSLSSCLFWSSLLEYIYSPLQHAAGVRLLRVSSALNTPTVLVQVHIIYSLPNILDNAARIEMKIPRRSLIRPLPLQWAITTLEDGQVHVNISSIRITKIQRITWKLHHNLSEGWRWRNTLDNFRHKVKGQHFMNSKPPCGRSIPTSSFYLLSTNITILLEQSPSNHTSLVRN